MFKSWTGLRRYIVILASFFSVVQLIDVINQIMPDQVLEIQGIFSVLVNFSGLAYIVIALWMAVGVIICSKIYTKETRTRSGKMAAEGLGNHFYSRDNCIAIYTF